MMTYFKFLLIVILSVFLNHCGETSPTAEPSGKEEGVEAMTEQTTQLDTALKHADCLKGVYEGELDYESGFWWGLMVGIADWGDNVDATISVAHNGRPEDLQVLFLIESKRGSICSSYGDLSHTVSQVFGVPRHELKFSSGSSSGKLGTRGSVVPFVHYFSAVRNDNCVLESLTVSDISNSALTLENENTTSMHIIKTGEAVFDIVKAKCEQVN